MNRTPLKRKTSMKRTAPLKAKSGKKRARPLRPCSWSTRCYARPRVEIDESERYCKPHAKTIADRVVGTWVKLYRDGRCLVCGTDQDLEWAHIRSRGAHQSLHWYVGPTSRDPGNSTTLCRGHHFAFTQRQSRWEVFVEKQWPGLYTRLIHLEIENAGKAIEPDLAEIIRHYRSLVPEDDPYGAARERWWAKRNECYCAARAGDGHLTSDHVRHTKDKTP